MNIGPNKFTGVHNCDQILNIFANFAQYCFILLIFAFLHNFAHFSQFYTFCTNLHILYNYVNFHLLTFIRKKYTVLCMDKSNVDKKIMDSKRLDKSHSRIEILKQAGFMQLLDLN